MSRRISEDFAELKAFFADYKITAEIFTEDQVLRCKQIHKKLYGFLILASELESQQECPLPHSFINEISSDLLLAFFCWAQGMYKPAKLELRCSIENFFKTLLFVTDSTIIEETQINTIIEKAKTDKHFLADTTQDVYSQLRGKYSFLCHTVHSDPQMFNPLVALNLLPQYDSTESEEVCRMFLQTLENYLGCIYFNYPQIIDSMHPDNKKDFLDCLSKKTKGRILRELFT